MQRTSVFKYFLIAKGYFYTLYLINRQITNLEVVPDTDLGYWGMKRIALILVMAFVFVAGVNSQQYINVKRACPQCMGYGAVTSYYGPVCCPSCGGRGYFVATILNPNYNPYGRNVNFQGAANNGSYTRTSYSVTVYTEDGYKKGNYAIYLHGGQKYISFSNTWICIQGKSRFGYNGNWYVIK